MNTAKEVNDLINEWKKPIYGYTKSMIVAKICYACLGWSYIYGARGEKCTPSTRRKFAKNYETRNPAESAEILKKCQVCRPSNPKGSCEGCKWYPGDVTLAYDCRGFTYWVFKQVGVSIQGAGATSQWNDDNNWVAKGEIKDMPDNIVCCVFMQKYDAKKKKYVMSHTGAYVGDYVIIHDSGEVKKGNPWEKGWTHYAVPKGLDGDIPVSHKTIKKGSKGADVLECQNDLIYLGYDLKADGIFGNATEAAVKDFQSKHTDAAGKPLKVDGIVGSSTWWALDEAVKPSPTPVQLYTVHIPHQNEKQCEEFKVAYPDSWKTEE